MPATFTPEPGETVTLSLFVGEMMRGIELPWLDHQVTRFDATTGDSAMAYRGLAGDLPAARIEAAPGLTIVAHTTVALPIAFDSVAEFREYLVYEGLGPVADEHRARGLPESGFVEHYSRSAKALVQAGPVRPDDSDRAVGLPFELVAGANPYATPDVMPVRLLWQSEPAADAPVAVFEERDGTVRRSLMTTDGDGRAIVKLTPGAAYLLNAVHIEPVEDAAHLWSSTWASLTFRVPAPDQ